MKKVLSFPPGFESDLTGAGLFQTSSNQKKIQHNVSVMGACLNLLIFEFFLLFFSSLILGEKFESS